VVEEQIAAAGPAVAAADLEELEMGFAAAVAAAAGRVLEAAAAGEQEQVGLARALAREEDDR